MGALTVLATSDVHGNALDWDYYADAPHAVVEVGLAQAATIIGRIRAHVNQQIATSPRCMGTQDAHWRPTEAIAFIQHVQARTTAETLAGGDHPKPHHSSGSRRARPRPSTYHRSTPGHAWALRSPSDGSGAANRWRKSRRSPGSPGAKPTTGSTTARSAGLRWRAA